MHSAILPYVLYFTSGLSGGKNMKAYNVPIEIEPEADGI